VAEGRRLACVIFDGTLISTDRIRGYQIGPTVQVRTSTTTDLRVVSGATRESPRSKACLI
jgi:hypothetical protein